MRIRAIPGTFAGRLDISAPQTLQPDNLVGYSDFTGRSMKAGDILELADEYYNFPSIKNGIALGFLEILSFGSDPSAIVVQAELSGTSGVSNYSGYSGTSGYSGQGGSGISGFSGAGGGGSGGSGPSGLSGFSGAGPSGGTTDQVLAVSGGQGVWSDELWRFVFHV